MPSRLRGRRSASALQHVHLQTKLLRVTDPRSTHCMAGNISVWFLQIHFYGAVVNGLKIRVKSQGFCSTPLVVLPFLCLSVLSASRLLAQNETLQTHGCA